MRIKVYTMELGKRKQNHTVQHGINRLSKQWKLWMRKKEVPKPPRDKDLICKGELSAMMAFECDKHIGYEEVTGGMRK